MDAQSIVKRCATEERTVVSDNLEQKRWWWNPEILSLGNLELLIPF